MIHKFRRQWKSSWLFAILIVAVLIPPFLVGYKNQKSDPYVGTWIWDASTIVTHRSEILEFSLQKNITHIYLYVDRNKAAEKDYILFIKEAAKHHIKVEALGGDPSWGRKEKRKHLQEFIEWVASYNTNVNVDEKFSGIHLDIEPYLLPEWGTDPLLLEEWLSNMEFAANHAKSFNGLEISVDVPFWVHQIELPGYEDYHTGTWMFRRFDTVVLMNYRDTAEGPDGIISNALPMLDVALSEGKSVVVGVETAPSREDRKTTFYEEGNERMEQELEISRKALEKYSSYRGIAIHGFEYWMKGESP